MTATAHPIDLDPPVLLTMTTDVLAGLIRILDHVVRGETTTDDIILARDLLTHNSVQACSNCVPACPPAR